MTTDENVYNRRSDFYLSSAVSLAVSLFPGLSVSLALSSRFAGLYSLCLSVFDRDRLVSRPRLRARF